MNSTPAPHALEPDPLAYLRGAALYHDGQAMRHLGDAIEVEPLLAQLTTRYVAWRGQHHADIAKVGRSCGQFAAAAHHAMLAEHYRRAAKALADTPAPALEDLLA